VILYYILSEHIFFYMRNMEHTVTRILFHSSFQKKAINLELFFRVFLNHNSGVDVLSIQSIISSILLRLFVPCHFF